MAESAQIRRWLKPRIVIRVVVLLILGAATNFGVMVFCVWRDADEESQYQRRPLAGSDWSERRLPFISASSLPHVWPRALPAKWPQSPDYAVAETRKWALLESISSIDLDTNPSEVWRRGMYSLHAGWPLRCWAGTRVVSRETSGAVDTDRVFGCISLPRPVEARVGFKYLPVGVKPIAFMTNLALYCGLFGGLWIFPRWTRGRLRARRGLCPTCAYPVGVSPVCTECGRAVTAVGPLEARA